MRPTFFNYARLPHHSARRVSCTRAILQAGAALHPKEWNFPAATLQRECISLLPGSLSDALWVLGVCDRALGLGADARMLSIRLDLGQMRVGRRRVHLIIRGRPTSPICRSFSLAPPPQAVGAWWRGMPMCYAFALREKWVHSNNERRRIFSQPACATWKWRPLRSHHNLIFFSKLY
jgi:hypothetical protein